MARTKVLLVELNEITCDLLDPLMEQGKLPTFVQIKREGTWAAPLSVDLPPQLDPWITWSTVYTGRPQADHNVFFCSSRREPSVRGASGRSVMSTACMWESTAACAPGRRRK